MKKYYLFAFFFIFFSCRKDKTESIIRPKNILIIGNSLTYSNKGLAYHLNNFVTNQPSLITDRIIEVAKPGYTLENHWNDTATVNKIKRGGWDIIILQEYSNRPVIEKDKMLFYAKKLDSLIKSTGNVKLYFFMTWAYKSNPKMINQLSDSYIEVAKSLNSAVIPVGLEWDKLLKSNPSINLYSDDKHPNINGTFFTASIFYKILFRKNPSENTYCDESMSKVDATLLKDWADKTNLIQFK